MEPFLQGDFSKVNKDSLNLGALDENNNRLPPAYTAHVDDNIFAEVSQYLPRSVTASVVLVDDVFGGRTMMVLVSPRRREKTIKYIEYEGWTTTKLKATMHRFWVYSNRFVTFSFFHSHSNKHLVNLPINIVYSDSLA